MSNLFNTLKSIPEDFRIDVEDDRTYMVHSPFQLPDGQCISLEVHRLDDGGVEITDNGESDAYVFVNGLTLNQTVRHVRPGVMVSELQTEEEIRLVVDSEDLVRDAIYEAIRLSLVMVHSAVRNPS